jgi:TatD DNase family protein
VAVGEIGLDFFVPSLTQQAAKEHQIMLFERQLVLAQEFKLPVIVHSRKAVDAVIQGLKRYATQGGIAHAFNGSLEQAKRLLDLGFKLGFGGAVTYENARHIRRLAQTLPLEAFVLETDAPDMPPQWLYVDAQSRANGAVQKPNTPSQLPKIARIFCELRGIGMLAFAEQTRHNAFEALKISAR